ncbi:MAG TPA: flagellar basal body FlgE domain-containing protein, partial [Oligoflexia bacterium]|nr:flagellar basal body FlgE domain-containing protein [Oligoflexia bacterium]
MKTYRCFLGALFVLFGLTGSLWACETRTLTAAGNLDANSDILIGGAATIPACDGTTDFLDLASTAEFSTSIDVFDSLGTQHAVTLYFFHTALNEWVVRAVVPAGDVMAGGPPTMTPPPGFDTTDPYAISSDIALMFLSNGTRNNAGDPDETIAIQWANGSAESAIRLTLSPFTQYASVSSIASVNQDGSSGACVYSGQLDYDGDGVGDWAIYRARYGIWAVRMSSSASGQFIWKQWGLRGDYPMAGDYTGDGIADLVVWRPANGSWYICPSNTLFDCTFATITQFGLPGDRPVRVDTDRDGTLDLAVWRPSTGIFYVKSSRRNEITAQQWGLPGDIPLTAASSQ